MLQRTRSNGRHLTFEVEDRRRDTCLRPCAGFLEADAHQVATHQRHDARRMWRKRRVRLGRPCADVREEGADFEQPDVRGRRRSAPVSSPRWRLVAADHPHATFATDVQAILQQALAVRDRFLSGKLSAAGLAIARGQLIAGLAARLDRASSVPDVARFAAHLDREFTAIWSFLFDPTIDATNWRAEHAIRPIVVTRKVCGGNRSWDGAESHQILASVIRTASQRNVNPHVVLDAPSAHARCRRRAKLTRYPVTAQATRCRIHPTALGQPSHRHSARSTSTGLTRIARRAGSQLAAMPVTNRSTIAFA